VLQPTASVTMSAMAETIWSIIALLGAIVVIAGVAYFIATGRDDREADEAQRRYFDEHGHWPDESPSN
jgi:beta-lactamase regulating signal transducer with metallopeptidase domain